MTITEEAVEDVLSTLERAEDRIERLKEERAKLLQANQKLVELVEASQDILEEIDMEEKERAEDTFDIQSHEYSFDQGWHPKDVVAQESLDLRPGVDAADIDEQLHKIRQAMDTIRKYKNE